MNVMRQILCMIILALLALSGCDRKGEPRPQSSSTLQKGSPSGVATTLSEARKGFTTRLVRRESANEPVPVPPPDIFRIVRYDSPAGKLAAYLTPDPGDGKRHPAIIWITGGDCNTIGDVWTDAPADNDQTAGAYRRAGIVMMFPSLRGGNLNPGVKEGFLGEVDDVLAAAKYLASLKYVDPARIYLGGHSTGGTLALIVAESSDRFRAVFSFGPVESVLRYPPKYTPFDTSDPREAELRSPGRWLGSIRSRTFVFEGTGGNISSMREMAGNSTNAAIRFLAVRGADHFSTLAPTNRIIADSILRDKGTACNMTFTEKELAKAFER